MTGTGYVPYYLVFDHHGDLVHHHQGGPYHGGDGTAVLDRVRTMLAAVPAVYTGKEPFERHGKLARELASGKKLRATLPKIARALAAAPDDAELQRLAAAVHTHVQRFVEDADRGLARDPASFFETLDAYAAATAETPWAARLEELAGAFDRAARKRHESAAKDLAKAMKRWAKLDPVRGNRGEVRNPLNDAFRRQNRRALEALARDLKQIATAHPELPVSRRAGELAELLIPPP